MLEFKPIEDVGKKGNYRVIIDGTLIPPGESSAFDIPTGLYVVIYEYRHIEKIFLYPFSDLPQEDIEIRLDSCTIEGLEYISNIEIRHVKSPETNELCYNFEFNFIDWKEFWSITEYANQFIRKVEGKASRVVLADETVTQGFGVYFNIDEPEANIGTEIDKKGDILLDIHDEVVKLLSDRIRQDNDAVVMSFDFPEEVKVPCEQYLLYFVQFIKDLGVEATAELQHEAGRVLFSVTPTNKETALDKIRAALEIYLRLSASPINDSSSLNNEIAIQRLVGEIQSLQSRLTLARAEIQFKDKTIEAQQFIIDRQRLSGDIMLESLKNVTPQPPKEDKEEVLGGIVEITKYEGKGINVNFAEVFRRLKEYLAKKTQ